MACALVDRGWTWRRVRARASGAYAAAQTDTVETDPIRCWWRTSAAAVRVGEPFSVVLTCAVVETDAVTVVPNQAELDPDAMQLPPFDVIGGSHGADLRTADHRFFQYQYRLRLVSEDLFGKDVELPELKISYRVRSRVDGEAVEGRDLVYVLPATFGPRAVARAGRRHRHPRRLARHLRRRSTAGCPARTSFASSAAC